MKRKHDGHKQDGIIAGDGAGKVTEDLDHLLSSKKCSFSEHELVKLLGVTPKEPKDGRKRTAKEQTEAEQNALYYRLKIFANKVWLKIHRVGNEYTFTVNHELRQLCESEAPLSPSDKYEIKILKMRIKSLEADLKMSASSPVISSEAVAAVVSVYKKLAYVLHPDRGGSTADMQELNVAMQTLRPLMKGSQALNDE